MALSVAHANQLLNHWLKATAFSDSKYISLHTGDPGLTGANEVTGGSYARQQVLDANWGVASGGISDNDNDVSFTLMPAATITHVGIWDAATVGTFHAGGALSASKTTNSGDTAIFNAGDLNVQFS